MIRHFVAFLSSSTHHFAFAAITTFVSPLPNADRQIMHQSNMAMKSLGLAAFAASAHALVATQRGEAFSVDAVPAPTMPQFDPVSELHRLWSKFPITTTVERRQEDAEKQKGSVLVKPNGGGLSYFVPTTIGNQTFQMLYDTGSADLWVISEDGPAWQADEGHPLYHPTTSAELLPNHTWSIKYAYGQSASGVVYTDTVKVGPLTATKQAIEAAVKITFETASDGILGLAPSIINQVQPEKQTTFFETLVPTLQKKVFAANLRIDGKGTWDFGYIDDSKFTGDITWAPVSGDQKHWQVDVGEYAVGNGSFSSAAVGEVIVDSGSALVYLPSAVVDDYYGQIEGYSLTQGGSSIFPCKSTLPDLNFKVGNGVLSIPGREVNYGTYDKAKDLCVGAITTQLNMKYSVLGNLWMRNYYVVHSHEDSTPKMGFALQK
jgi:aspergillopepsin I